MKKGFTLVELLVSIAIFSVAITVAVGAFTHALRTQREITGLISAQSNAGLTLEQMAREIRTGYDFCSDATTTVGTQYLNDKCSSVCSYQNDNGQSYGDQGSLNDNKPKVWNCPLLDFYNAHEEEVEYIDSDGILERSENGGTPLPITSGNVTIKDLSFLIFGNNNGDNISPRITISLGVSPSSTDQAVANNVLYLQTTVSADVCGSGVGSVGGC